jgi:ribosome-binding factor A
MSRRSDQVAASLRDAVQAVIDRGLQDPRITGLITVTAVTLDEGLRDAVVSVSILPAERQSVSFHGLVSAAAHIRRAVGDRLALRRVPALSFRLDESLKRQAAVIDALAKVARERESARQPGPSTHTDDAAEGS